MTKQFVRVEDFDTVQFDKDSIILNSETFTVTKVNELGGFCWSLLKESHNIPSLMEAIHREYDWRSETLEQEIEAFLQELIGYGLVRHVD